MQPIIHKLVLHAMLVIVPIDQTLPYGSPQADTRGISLSDRIPLRDHAGLRQSSEFLSPSKVPLSLI